MISLIFIVLAAISNAVMDKTQFHYGKSVFKNMNPQFWNPDIAWRNKYIGSNPDNGFKLYGLAEYLVAPYSAWHLFQSIFLNCLFLAVIFYQPIVSWWIDFLIYRVVFGLVFELFYSKVLR